MNFESSSRSRSLRTAARSWASKATKRSKSSPTKSRKLDPIPLLHGRALLANPSSCASEATKGSKPSRTKSRNLDPIPLLHERALLAYQGGLDSASAHSHASQSTSSMDSVVVGTKVKGKVLVLQARIGSDVVEAVSVSQHNKSDNDMEPSYAERLLPDQTHAGEHSAPAVLSVAVDANPEQVRREYLCRSGDGSDETSKEGPLFMNMNGEISSLQDSFDEGIPASRSAFPALDRYAVSGDFHGNQRVPSGTMLVSRSDCPVADRNAVLNDANSTKLYRIRSVPLEATTESQRKTTSTLPSSKFEEMSLASQASSASAGMQSVASGSTGSVTSNVDPTDAESEWDYLRALAAPTIREDSINSLLLLDRSTGSTAASSVFSEDLMSHVPSFNTRYSSFDLGSVASIASGFDKPLSVSQDLQDMYKELADNPSLLIKWLNPL